MNGLDQDMMQKNLSLKNIKEAKKNFLSFSLAFIPVNFIFLCLGVLFFIYMNINGIPIPAKTDSIYPLLATQYLPAATGVFFMLGVIAAAFSSANSALIAMTDVLYRGIFTAYKTKPSNNKNASGFIHISPMPSSWH